VRDDPNGTNNGGEPANPEDDHTPGIGVNCYFTGQGAPGDSPYTADVDGGCTYLESPIMDFSGSIYAELSVMRWWYDNQTVPADALTIEISTNGGTDWIELEQILGKENEWTESKFRLKLSDIPLTSSMMLRFTACDELTGSIIEGAVDDVWFAKLTGDIPTDVASTEVPASFQVHQNSPNPFNPITSIQYEVAATGPVSIQVFNVAGQVVRTLVDAPVEAGVHSVRWDGTNDSGKPVASGLYYYRVNAGTFESVHKMTLLK
jgi:hypothetical protein